MSKGARVTAIYKVEICYRWINNFLEKSQHATIFEFRSSWDWKIAFRDCFLEQFIHKDYKDAVV